MRWRTWGFRIPRKPKKAKAHNPKLTASLPHLIRARRIRTHLNQMLSRKMGADKYALARALYEGELIPINDAKEMLGL